MYYNLTIASSNTSSGAQTPHMERWYTLTAEAVLKKLDTHATGLSAGMVAQRQSTYGKNVLKEGKKKTRLAILLAQFRDIMIIILFIAAGISFAVGEHTDAYVILAIILGNALIGFIQENNAEHAVQMLQQMAAQTALVVREDNPGKIDAGELVPGDIILLEAGDIVPADARLIELSAFKTEEAALTGESHPIEKQKTPLEGEDLGAGDQLNMVFKGTTVGSGSARAVVTATGMDTEIGKIAGMLHPDEEKTPLQKRLAVFSKQLALIVIGICIVVFGAGLWRGEPPFIMFLTALSLAVAALPEALPAVVTIALSQGARRMAGQKALIRRLPAVETLGSVTYICSDKTGTLTQNRMTVEKIQSAPDREELLIQAMMLDNEVKFSDNGEILGDSTETALVHYAGEKGAVKEDSDQRFPLQETIPFDSERMRMSTLHRDQDKWILFVKGAPGKMAELLSPKYRDQAAEWLDLNREWAADGLRVLFFAYKELDTLPDKVDESLERELDFLGLVAMIDPPREEVIEAIRQCNTAGIKTVMITGDQPLTATAIAERLQMSQDDQPQVRTGAELSKMDAAAFEQEVAGISVYARVSPEQKLNIVKALQHNGQFVAMTGDGVNDAPSLKQADIGVAMGITGTGVSKESADMILLDDNFATIVKAVKEGRRIYDNIRKFILYVLSCNLAEILTIFFAPVFGLAIPLLPIHILWINLVTDGLPGLALSAEPAEKGIMNRPPRPPRENLFAGGTGRRIIYTGSFMAATVLLAQAWAANQGYDVNTQQTLVFTLLCFVQLGNALSVRSTYHSIFSRHFFTNRGMWLAVLSTIILQILIVYLPGLHPIFKTTSLSTTLMGPVLLITLLSLLGIELIKYLAGRSTQKYSARQQ